jgi:hypothetical protein
MIVVIPCGARKLSAPAPAGKMYIGSYAQMCQRYAQSLTTPDNIFILSAKYGLLRLTDEIQPYSLTLGEPGCITPKQIKQQAMRFGIIDELCIAIGGRRYVDYCRLVWKNCKTPLQDNVKKGGNGRQLQWMKGQLV